LVETDRYLLRVEELETGYGKKQVINGVSLTVKPGEVVALIGHNGAGKSTVLKAIFGLLKVWNGKIIYDGAEIQGCSPIENIKDGMAFVPQGNRVFTELTVLENLEMGGYTLSDKQALQKQLNWVFEIFPVLQERMHQLAGTLSGGEKQMLALANALILSPRLLLLDEPSLGLSPPLIKIAFERIIEINKNLGTSILIVEQKVREVLGISDRTYILKVGKVSFEGPSVELLKDDKIRKIYL
jgi:branched-chain amino acid transport system ATP-binding protein